MAGSLTKTRPSSALSGFGNDDRGAMSGVSLGGSRLDLDGELLRGPLTYSFDCSLGGAQEPGALPRARPRGLPVGAGAGHGSLPHGGGHDLLFAADPPAWRAETASGGALGSPPGEVRERLRGAGNHPLETAPNVQCSGKSR